MGNDGNRPHGNRSFWPVVTVAAICAASLVHGLVTGWALQPAYALTTTTVAVGLTLTTTVALVANRQRQGRSSRKDD